ncbi:hypothetical protein OAK17_00505 [Alphaproteobacteria bacterium]|nr:hypothetical protein [Alphaproteobacteria bacterium]
MIFLFCKEDIYSKKAIKIANEFFKNKEIMIYKGNRFKPFPKINNSIKPNIIISFLSPWVIPESLLFKSKLSINFHPGTHHYPGTGCYNFALYESATNYGSVCHHMNSSVDTGCIIDEKTFFSGNVKSVLELKTLTMDSMIKQFEKIISIISKNKKLPKSNIQWSRKPFIRKELEELRKITLDMTKIEINKRIKAITFPGYPGVEIDLDGIKFINN